MPRPRLPGTVLPPRSTLDQHPDHVSAIGMMSVEVGNLEFMLGELLGSLLHIDPDFGAIVYLTPKSYSGRLEILKNVVSFSLNESSGVRKKIDLIIQKAERYIGKRHALIHESWGVSVENSTQVVRRPMPYLDKRPAKVVTVRELTDLVENMRELADEVRLLTQDLLSEWPPYTSQPTPREPPPES
jgi:hypothetical protein